MTARLTAHSFDDPAWNIVTRGATQLAERKLSDAIASFSEAIDAFTERTPMAAVVETFICRGVASGRSGDARSAIADFSKAIELNPKCGLAYYNRGYSKEKLGEYCRAIQDYDLALERHPGDADSYLRRGVCRKRVNDLVGAQSDFAEARRLKRTRDR
jgi:tetratricopeptide (TPR) repeat protein